MTAIILVWLPRGRDCATGLDPMGGRRAVSPTGTLCEAENDDWVVARVEDDPRVGTHLLLVDWAR